LPFAKSGIMFLCMYLRKHIRQKDGASYEYWTLVETVRTARGPRQRIVGNLGKLPGLDREERIGWEEVGRVLSGKGPERQPELFSSDPEPPDWARVDLRQVRAERLRRFGDAYLALAVWRRLGLDTLLADILPAGRAEIGWDALACLLVLARFCEPSSELAIAEHFYGTTALDDLLGIPPEKVNDDRLYRALDALLPHKDAICSHLAGRYAEWFGTQVDFLLYDVTSTYFEGQAAGDSLAARGYSRDHRPDCPQVCIGLAATPEGLPVGYEVFAGNRADVTTLEDMVALLEGRYGQARRIWVFDRGIVSEDNLAMLRSRGARYVVGTPKSMLRKFEAQLLAGGWEQAAESGVEVRTATHPDFAGDSFILCRSLQRREKEHAILATQADRLDAKLAAIQASVRAGRLRDRATAERRIGRWLGKFSRAEDLFRVELVPAEGPLEDMRVERRKGGGELGGARPGRLPAAHQRRGRGPRPALAVVYPARPGGGRLPHEQERPRPASRIPPEGAPGRGPHPGLFPGPGPPAQPGAVDERQGAGNLRPPPRRRDARGPQPRHRARRHRPGSGPPARCRPARETAAGAPPAPRAALAELPKTHRNRRKRSAEFGLISAPFASRLSTGGELSMPTTAELGLAWDASPRLPPPIPSAL